MANTLHIHDADLLSQHQANIIASLSHRLEVARATHNTQLIALLEQEQRQLRAQGIFGKAGGLTDLTYRIRQWWAGVINAIENSSKLSVERIVDETGSVWWYAFDPCTGKTLYAETEAEVMQWIEENQLGH